MQKWQYLVMRVKMGHVTFSHGGDTKSIPLDGDYVPFIASVFTQLGAEGWEQTGAVSDGTLSDFTALFKRPIE